MTASKHSILALIIIGLVPFFFIGGPSEYSPRSHERLWDLGNIVFFMGLTVLLLNRKTMPARFTIQCLAAIILSIVVGAVIELLQSMVNISPDVYD